METVKIKGYDYGSGTLEKSPVTMEDMDLLKKTLLWSDVLKDQVSDVLDLWYGYVGGNEHLVYYFTSNGQPDGEYLSNVRARFEQWVLDLCNEEYDQNWLNYQHEIAKRHHSTKKNKTDNVDSVPIINFRYIVAFIYPITATIKPFLSNKGNTNEEVEGMYNAWFKAVTLTALLWCYPYINKNEF